MFWVVFAICLLVKIVERKRYLELCQMNAVGNSVFVVARQTDYKPQSYKLSFDKKGNPVHTAVLLDKNENSVIHCNLSEVEENEN